MRKFLAVLALAALAVLVLGAVAFADPVTAATGEGKDASPSADPIDPTSLYGNLLTAPLFLGAEGDQGTMSGGIAVAVGDEGTDNSVGRASVSGSPDGATIYAEDYTTGDVVANAVETVNEATGCALLNDDPDACDPAADDPSDAVRVDITPGA